MHVASISSYCIYIYIYMICTLIHFIVEECFYSVKNISYERFGFAGDKNTIHPILYWLLSNLEALSTLVEVVGKDWCNLATCHCESDGLIILFITPCLSLFFRVPFHDLNHSRILVDRFIFASLLVVHPAVVFLVVFKLAHEMAWVWNHGNLRAPIQGSLATIIHFCLRRPKGLLGN